MESSILIRYGALDAHFEQARAQGLRLGRVERQEKLLYTIITEGGAEFLAVTGRFRHLAENPGQYPVAGDWVLFSARGIEALLPRQSFLVRVAAGAVPYPQPIAANMDILFVCMPADATYNPAMLERFLAAAVASGAKTVVVLTKADLCGTIEGRLAGVRAFAPNLDAVTCTSSRPDGFDPARAYMRPGVTAALIGMSGAGKSTLINALSGASIETQEVRKDGKGRHTTTRRELILLPAGGVLIDTPGMRELALETSDVASAFPELDALAKGCRFRDCAHGDEPGCAVREAVSRGEVDARRYHSYLKLLSEQNRRETRRRSEMKRKH
ncbi:MAG TPA: ribosome small subunit-dependent GTPase A [Clostridia bacterium]|nr:ribosome small subunit-dependent GTPase A [Clostridia bacterium]